VRVDEELSAAHSPPVIRFFGKQHPDLSAARMPMSPASRVRTRKRDLVHERCDGCSSRQCASAKQSDLFPHDKQQSFLKQELVLPPESSTDLVPSRRTRRRAAVSIERITVELVCLMCNRDIGILECSAWPTYGPVALRQPKTPPVLVGDWRRLRCGTCRGAAIPDEITRRFTRVEAPIDWLADRPRRGRPPKALAAQRRQGNAAS
jgi:hypothetical protein